MAEKTQWTPMMLLDAMRECAAASGYPQDPSSHIPTIPAGATVEMPEWLVLELERRTGIPRTGIPREEPS